MRVALIHYARLPVGRYGGTERVVWWLAKGLSELGVDVSIACQPGSECPFARVVFPDPSKPIEAQLPGVEFFHHFVTPASVPTAPYAVTIEGNGKEGETFLPNTIFVSRNHASRHGAECFVYNGLDPDDYEYQTSKSNSLAFLAKASWKVKNVRGAIRFARKSGRPLRIMGGNRLLKFPWSQIRWEGMLGGREKARILADSAALLFPVIWNEPFGIAVIESLVSGTPVIASPFGSLPELIPPSVGAICRSEEEFLAAIDRLGEWKSSDCREWVMDRFHYRKMAESYLALYQQVLRGENLNSQTPRARESSQLMFTLD